MSKELKGITVDGESLESYLSKSAAKEITKTLEARKHYLKKGRRVKYMDHKEPNGKPISLREKVVNALIHGQIFTTKDVCEMFNVPHATSAASILRSIYKSEFGQLYMTRIEEKNNGKTHYVYGIPDYIEDTGVRFSDINLSLKTAIKLSKNMEVKHKFPKLEPKVKGVVQTTPCGSSEAGSTPDNPIVKDVVVNVTIKLKLEVS